MNKSFFFVCLMIEVLLISSEIGKKLRTSANYSLPLKLKQAGYSRFCQGTLNTVKPPNGRHLQDHV